MKIIFLDRSLEPFFKNGPGAIALGIGSTVSGITGSLIQADSSKSISKAQLSAQKEENQLNRAWQTQQAEIARRYNTSERLAAQEYDKQMLDYTNAYNTPVMQAGRLQEAGLNPQIAMAGSVQNVSSVAQKSTPQTSPMPSSVSGLSPVPQQPLDLQIPQMLNGVGNLIKNVADAKGKNVETDRMIQTFNDFIQQAHFDTQIKELSKDTLSIDKFIKEEVKDAAVLKAWDEAKKANYDAVLAGNEVSLYDINKRILESQEALNKALSSYHGNNAELVRMDIGSYNRRVNSVLKLQDAQAKQAISSAFNEDALKALNEAKTDREKIQKIGDIIANGVRSNEFTLGQLGLTSAQLKQLQDAKYLENLKDPSGVPLWFDNFFHRLKDYVPAIPIGFVKGIK